MESIRTNHKVLIAATFLLLMIALGIVLNAQNSASAKENEEEKPSVFDCSDITVTAARNAFNASALLEKNREEIEESVESSEDVEMEYGEYEEDLYIEENYEDSYDYGTYVYDGSGEGYGENGPTRYMPGEHNGRKETYYSSNVLYHNRTGEWTADEEGFYRDDNGYYIVGVGLGEYEIGDVIDTG